MTRPNIFPVIVLGRVPIEPLLYSSCKSSLISHPYVVMCRYRHKHLRLYVFMYNLFLINTKIVLMTHIKKNAYVDYGCPRAI